MTIGDGPVSPGAPPGSPDPAPWPRTILHVDMDAFYAAVEVILDPNLAGKPVIVGGTGGRGVVASCSYEARAFGVRSAMASVHARRLCPNAIFVPGHHGVYADYSRRIHEVFDGITPLIEPIALDEAFLDVTRARRLFGDGPAIAREIRTRVRSATGLWCCVGVATSKLIAKLASKAAKPPIGPNHGEVGDGTFVVEPGQEIAFLHPQPVRALWGVGPATFARLARYGVQTVGDLARLPEDVVVRALGSVNGRHLHGLAWGLDDRPVEVERPLKSVGHEETFAEDRYSTARLAPEALRMADSVARRMRQAGVRGRTVQLKVRFADFRTITRSKTVDRFVDTVPIIYSTAIAMLEEAELRADVESLGVRLLGVSVANLTDPKTAGRADETQQLDLFSQPSGEDQKPRRQTEERVAAAVDEIRSRFGDAAVGPAALVAESGLRVKTTGDTQWGPNHPL